MLILSTKDYTGAAGVYGELVEPVACPSVLGAWLVCRIGWACLFGGFYTERSRSVFD